ncbi:MAG: DUF1559 domain-containing protein [Pirellulales bacterium]|nr:DUF1559 domain-containing protein [Pirellulales bacterium]
MPIPFTCPYCGAETTVSDEFGGRTGPCACCGSIVTVPGPGTQARPRGSRSTVTAFLIVTVFLGGAFALLAMIAFLLLPALTRSPDAVRRMHCQTKLELIGAAMKQYHAQYGSFPPAYVADAEGRPLHGWRVLLLPYLGEEALYRRYRFDEPWDGPNNRRLAGSGGASLYACPADDADDAAGQTSYLMLVGPGAISDGPGATKLADIKNDPATTLVVVEVSDSGIGWMEPRDLPVDKMSFGVNDGSPLGLRSRHRHAVHALAADGHVEELSEATDPEWVKEMTLIGKPAAAPID